MNKSKDTLDSLSPSLSKVDIKELIRTIPKAELHVHIEGTLEPELMLKFARRNQVSLNNKSIEEIKKAYNFSNLKSFLDIYYEGTKVLVKEEDFYELTWEYLKDLSKQNVTHAEIFFDPQAHTSRGVPFEIVIDGISKALHDGKEKLGISSYLIMCFLRHLSVASAMNTLEMSTPFKDKIIGVGLDSIEIGNPPRKFTEVFKKASSLGYKLVAHAGEEGPPEYIWEAINKLKVERIDHGVNCTNDPLLVDNLVKSQIPLTVCPLSNVRLGVFKKIEEHNIKKLLDLGLNVTVNSDDPAYFGGNINENFILVHKAFNLSISDVYKLAKNSFQASFLSKEEKEIFINKLDKFVFV